MTKRQQNARRHVEKRAWQRFGLAVAPADLIAAEQAIWRGDADWIGDFTPMRQAYWVKLKNKRVVAVFDIHLEIIITVLPSEAWLWSRTAQRPERKRARA